MVFQDPMSSLNPVYRIGDQIVEQIRAHDRDDLQGRGAATAPSSCSSGSASRARGERVRSYPHEFSRRHAPARDDRDGALVLARAC